MISPTYNLPTIKEALLYRKLKKGKVKCGLCERKCTVFPGKNGFCQVRVNLNGTYYTLVYGNIAALESRPIEIKPFFHFYPGTTALTFSTWSCNFNCPWCQNYTLSKRKLELTRGNYISPEEIVKTALNHQDEGICLSFTEPTLLFEYALDVFPLAQRNNLYNCIVSNGYMSLKALYSLKEAGLDGIKIDLKGDEKFYRQFGLEAQVVLRNAQKAKEIGLHLEIVNLLITDLNDSDDCIDWVIENHLKFLGEEVPLHFTRYYPAYQYFAPSTRIEILEKAYEKAKKAGVLYPYLGNVPGHKGENTYCPRCGFLLMKRYGPNLIKVNLDGKSCPKCHFKISIVLKSKD